MTPAPLRTASGKDEDYVPLGLHGLLSATEKIKGVSRGAIDQDDRDSLAFKTYLSPADQLRERIRLDSGKTRLNILRKVARMRNLNAVSVNAFDPYTKGLLIGNPLASPLEETNPMHVVEQARRLSAFGEGGLGSEDAITTSAQAVNASQFGYIDPVAGPECYDQLSEVYTKRGWTPWQDVRDDDEFACRVDGSLEWHKASRIVRAPYKGPILVAESTTVRLAVTPNHRVLWKSDPYVRQEHISEASTVFGANIRLPIRHAPYVGDKTFTHFHLPELPKTNNNQRQFAPFPITDWCRLMGWWLSEGNSYIWDKSPTERQRWVGISQSREVNPKEYEAINQLLRRLGITRTSEGNGVGFRFASKQLGSYFTQRWTNGCYDKWIPGELFEAPIEARKALLDALLQGDGRYQQNRWCYCSVSLRLARDVERLALSLGYTAFIREEPDKRPHGKTTNYVVSLHRDQNRQVRGKAYGSGAKRSGNNWRTEDYDGLVYCATVPGGLLHVRGKKSTSGIWCGNSAKAGLDSRLSDGVRYGDDGNLYQVMTNARTGKKEWVAHTKAARSTIKLPD